MTNHVPQHGTRSEYQHHGCRCHLCREASAKYQRHYRKHGPSTPRRTEPRHGTVSEYTNHRCRCADCCAAKAAAKKHYRETRKERTNG